MATRRGVRERVEDYDDFRDLESGLEINELGLDEALASQPQMFYRVGAAYAMAVSRRDAAKQALSDAEAAADGNVRRGAQEDDRKITEGEVRAGVQLDSDVVRARDRLLALSEVVGKLGALKEAYQQRSYALKDLAGLYVANYYSASDNNPGRVAVRERDAGEARVRMSAARRGA